MVSHGFSRFGRGSGAAGCGAVPGGFGRVFPGGSGLSSPGGLGRGSTGAAGVPIKICKIRSAKPIWFVAAVILFFVSMCVDF
jgi:hypothetical protein